MNIFKTYNVMISVFLLSALGCTHKLVSTTQKSDISPNQTLANSIAEKNNANFFTDIEFSPSSALLSDRAVFSLNEIMRIAKNEGSINEIIVLSWSDEEYPSSHLKNLSKQQRKLADSRNLSIKQYIESFKGLNVDTYNMAERPTKLSQWFNTTDNKLKSSLLSAGLSTTADSYQFLTKASHAMVLMKIE